jgi:quercetin dioxygenase-like cupin family protein
MSNPVGTGGPRRRASPLRSALTWFVFVLFGCRANADTVRAASRDFGRAAVIGRGEGEVRMMRGTRPLFIVADPVTVGSRSLVAGYEDVPPGDSGKTHRHLHQDEIIFVHRGEFAILLGDSVRRAPAGSTVFIPRGTWVGFRNASADTAGFFFVFNTPSFEKCLRGLSSRPGEPYIPPMGAALQRVSEQCDWVVKDNQGRP